MISNRWIWYVVLGVVAFALWQRATGHAGLFNPNPANAKPLPDSGYVDFFHYSGPDQAITGGLLNGGNDQVQHGTEDPSPQGGLTMQHPGHIK